jgi:D-alanyl-D-alanine carboxypeptidase
MRGIRILALSMLCVATTVAGAAGAAPYAALVMDARNGKVLHAEGADRRLHPASLTKMMTLYLAIEAVETGKIGLDERVPVSRYAASKPASKVGFKSGTKVRFRDLIRSAAVRSANDSAVVIAEAISGSEAEFAKLMTRRGRELGLTNTTFKNASGLTQKGHLSTARDMALLGRRLFYDWPEYYNLFGRKNTRAFGKTFWTTNKLLSSYRGADGIKTGYTRAAGFNLVASAERGPERVIVSMFGGKSSASRNRQVAKLLDVGFKKAPTRVVEVPPTSALALVSPPPPPRPNAQGLDMQGGFGAASLLAAGARRVGEALAPAAAQAAVLPLETPLSVAALVDPTPLAPRRGPPPTPRGGATSDVAGWAVQLGAYAQREVAVASLAAASFGALPQLVSADRRIEQAGASLWRARLTGLDAAGAHAACRALEREGRDCMPVPPGR